MREEEWCEGGGVVWWRRSGVVEEEWCGGKRVVWWEWCGERGMVWWRKVDGRLESSNGSEGEGG